MTSMANRFCHDNEFGNRFVIMTILTNKKMGFMKMEIMA